MGDLTGYRRPTLRSHPRIWLRRLGRSWTVLVWLAAAILAVILASTGSQFGEILGVIETVAEPVAPLETARLATVPVTPGQAVKAGEALATLDPALVDAELRVADAELAEARDTLSTYQTDMLQMVQRADSALLEAETALQTTRIQQARDQAELAELKKEQQRREELLAKRLVSEELVSALRPAIAVLEQSLAAAPATIQLQARRLAQGRQAREEMQAWLRVGEDKDVSAAIREKARAVLVIAEAKRRQLDLRRTNYVLRAARAGIVSQVLHNPGDVVPAAEPVLRVIPAPDHVAGFLPEIQLSELQVGQCVCIRRRSGLGLPVAAVVESIGPEVQTLPGRVAPIRGQPLRGRRVLLKLPDGHPFLPGETVTISNAKPLRERLQEQLTRFAHR